MMLTANNLKMDVRAGTIADVPVLLSFIRAMAAFEKLEVSATEESLKTALFGENPAARVILVFVKDQPIAYVTYFFTFASMTGKRGLWLDDLYVDPAFRKKGVGQTLMAYLAGIARQNHCGRFEWMVLEWNTSAIRFYERLGASILPDWRICRLDEAQLAHLAEKQAWANDGG